MDMSFRKQLNDNRPYWKVLVSLVFSLLATILFVFIGIRMLIFFTPFVIGWFLAYIATPVVNWLEKRLKIVRKLGSVIMIIGVLAAVVLVLYLLGSQIMEEVQALLSNMPEMYQDLSAGLGKIGNGLEGVSQKLPNALQNGLDELVNNLNQTIGTIIGKFSRPTVTAAGNIAKQIPAALIGTIVTFISAYFFIAEREEVIVWAKKVSPDPIVKRMTLVMDNLKYAVGGYFKAQLKIMVVVFTILTVGFMLLHIRFSFLLAILIAFLDFLPFFGTGTALMPWALYKFLVGNYKMAAALMVIYAVTQLVRQLIQPKLVGDSMGMKPLLTLVLLYAGYKIGGIIAMIFAVPIGLIVLNLYKAGAFDYILDDVKILLEGILSLRE